MPAAVRIASRATTPNCFAEHLHHPYLSALDAFATPFLTICAEGQVRHRSDRALALLEKLPSTDSFERRVGDVVRSALSSGASRIDFAVFSKVADLTLSGPVATVEVFLATRRVAVTGLAAVAILHPARTPEHTWTPPSGVTPREADVARLICQGASAKQIAGYLAISEHTARRHTERLYAKLGVRSRAALTNVWMSVNRPR